MTGSARPVAGGWKRLERLAFTVSAALGLIAIGMWIYGAITLDGWARERIGPEIAFWYHYLWMLDWLVNAAIAFAVLAMLGRVMSTPNTPHAPTHKRKP